jgi:hypothetical protein
MAVYRYATKDLSITTAEAFVSRVQMSNTDADGHSSSDNLDTRNSKRSTILYVCLGRAEDWPDEPTPIQPPDNEQHLHYELQRKFIGGKRVTKGDISHVTDRHDWTSGTVYSMYRDTDTDMYDRPFYVLTNQNNVYKCLNNNKGAASTIKPTGFSILPFTTSDGYTWKYMYTISLGEEQKFMTASHMPVKRIDVSDGGVESTRQVAVQNAAVNGAIHIIETVDVGSGYHSVANGVVEAGGKYTLKLFNSPDDPPSPIDNFYNGASVYIISGTGAGQLRRIIDYSGQSKTLTVNTAFQTIANSDSRVIVSPTVTIIGDGKGAKAYSLVDKSDGSIANVAMISIGSSYTRAKALISSNSIHGAGATANVVISPSGGHGKNPVRELYADKVMLNVQFNGAEGVSANGNGYIPSNTEFRTISVLRDPILKVDANNNTTTTENVANTSNAPVTLRLCSRAVISYNQMSGSTPINALQENDTITNERNRLRAELGSLEFVTELGPQAREDAALANAVKAANANIVYIREDENESDPSFYTMYINNVESYSDYAAFVKDDVILKSDSETKIATVEAIKGPEANTFSGEVIYTENLQAVTRDPEQVEDIKIILDF